MPPLAPSPDLGRLDGVLGPLRKVAFGPPHIYPMSAPRFSPTPGVERPSLAVGAIKLYVHVPFCNYACTFCFYAKRVGADAAAMERYVRAVIRELEFVKPGTLLTELFVGGGTPTALPAALLDELLSAIRDRLGRSGDDIHTVEAAPDSIGDDHLDALRRNGIGRISMGIQSLDEHVLEDIHRRHTSRHAIAAARRILGCGFLLNCDLIYGLPGYTEDMFRRDFGELVEAGIHSVTVYNLRVNRQTPVAARIDGEGVMTLAGLLRWRMFIGAVASDFGFVQTRWHTYKRPSEGALRHQRATSSSDGGDGHQLGLGASARSHLGHTIYRNHQHPATYAARIEAGESPVEDSLPLSGGDLKAMHVARTLGDGCPLDLDAYAHCFGTRFETEFAPVVNRLAAAGLLCVEGESVRLSATGRLVHDLITEMFYPARARAWLDRQQEGLDRFKEPAGA